MMFLKFIILFLIAGNFSLFAECLNQAQKDEKENNQLMKTFQVGYCSYKKENSECLYSKESCERSMSCNSIYMNNALKNSHVEDLLLQDQVALYKQMVLKKHLNEMKEIDYALKQPYQKQKGPAVVCRLDYLTVTKSKTCDPQYLQIDERQDLDKCGSFAKKSEKDACKNRLAKFNNKTKDGIRKFLQLSCPKVPTMDDICNNVTAIMHKQNAEASEEKINFYLDSADMNKFRTLLTSSSKDEFNKFSEKLSKEHKNLTISPELYLRLKESAICKITPPLNTKSKCIQTITDNLVSKIFGKDQECLNSTCAGLGSTQRPEDIDLPEERVTHDYSTNSDNISSKELESKQVDPTSDTIVADIPPAPPVPPVLPNVPAQPDTPFEVPGTHPMATDNSGTPIPPPSQPISNIPLNPRDYSQYNNAPRISLLSPEVQAVQKKLDETQTKLDKLTSEIEKTKSETEKNKKQKELDKLNAEIKRLEAEKLAVVAAAASARATAAATIQQQPIQYQEPKAQKFISNTAPDIINTSTAPIASNNMSKNIEPSSNIAGKAPDFDAKILLLIKTVSSPQASNSALTDEQAIQAVVTELYSKKNEKGEPLYNGEAFPWNGYIVVANKDKDGKIIITKVKNSKLSKVRAPASLPVQISLPESKKLDEKYDPTRLYQMDAVLNGNGGH